MPQTAATQAYPSWNWYVPEDQDNSPNTTRPPGAQPVAAQPVTPQPNWAQQLLASLKQSAAPAPMAAAAYAPAQRAPQAPYNAAAEWNKFDAPVTPQKATPQTNAEWNKFDPPPASANKQTIPWDQLPGNGGASAAQTHPASAQTPVRLPDGSLAPSWYTSETASTPTPANGPYPSWYRSETSTQGGLDWNSLPGNEHPPGWSAPNAPAQSPQENWGALAKSAITDAPGTIIGLPRTVFHDLPSWLAAKAKGAITGQTYTPQEIQAGSPTLSYLTGLLPSSEGVNRVAHQITGTPEYQPVTPQGQIASTAINAGTAAMIDPLSVVGDARKAASVWQAFKNLARTGVKGAIGGGAAQGTQELFPQTPGLAVATALATHGGLSAASKATGAGYRTFLKPFVSPSAAGEDVAARAVTQAGPAPQTLSDSSAAAKATAFANRDTATGALVPQFGEADAMGNMRGSLAATQSGLQDARAATVKPYYDAFRQETPLNPDDLADLRQQLDPTTLNNALNASATDMRNTGADPYAWRFDTDDNGNLMLNKDALTPDLLDRAHSKLNDMAANAAANQSGQSAAAMRSAARTVTGFLDDRYPNTYPQARNAYADASAPLGPFDRDSVSNLLATQRDAVGNNLGFKIPDEAIFDKIAKRPSTVSDLIDAAGNKEQVTGPLQDALLDRLWSKGAIDPTTGDVNAKVYAREVQPYIGTIGVHFPELANKWRTATDAQQTLDSIRTQESLASDVRSGAMRDGNLGIVTANSAAKWLRQNRDAIVRSQGNGALLRLQALANALPNSINTAPEAALEAGSIAAGGVIGHGLEGGVLGGITHRVPAFLTAPFMQQYATAYNNAVETAFRDPAYAARLSAQAAKYRGVTAQQALWRAIKDTMGDAAVRGTIPANAALSSRGSAQQ